jgi:hypothetical protein
MAVCEQRALAYIGQLNTTTITRSSTRVRHTGAHEVLLCPPSALSSASPTSLSPACSCWRGGEVTLCVSTEQLAHARTHARTHACTHARTQQCLTMFRMMQLPPSPITAGAAASTTITVSASACSASTSFHEHPGTTTMAISSSWHDSVASPIATALSSHTLTGWSARSSSTCACGPLARGARGTRKMNDALYQSL